MNAAKHKQQRLSQALLAHLNRPVNGRLKMKANVYELLRLRNQCLSSIPEAEAFKLHLQDVCISLLTVST